MGLNRREEVKSPRGRDKDIGKGMGGHRERKRHKEMGSMVPAQMRFKGIEQKANVSY